MLARWIDNGNENPCGTGSIPVGTTTKKAFFFLKKPFCYQFNPHKISAIFFLKILHIIHNCCILYTVSQRLT